MRKIIVLTFVSYYLPSYKAGGPVRTIANMVSILETECGFRIVTSDRDLGDKCRFEHVKADCWTHEKNTEIFYASPRFLTIRRLMTLLRQTPHDLLYVNSLFNPTYGFRLLVASVLSACHSKKAILIAPRGVFSEGALKIKGAKKKLYIGFLRIFALLRKCYWQASSEAEAASIRRVLGVHPNRVYVAPDLAILPDNVQIHKTQEVERNTPLRIVFLSRLSPMKNLDFALRVLGRVQATVVFTIYGPIEDSEYWAACKHQISLLPANVTARYCGSVAAWDVREKLSEHDLFFLPTRGENYGHAIIEALGSGTPVLISDQTPWHKLREAGAGWSLSLSDLNAFVDRIDGFACWSREAKMEARIRAFAYAKRTISSGATFEANKEMFFSLMENR